MPWFEYYCELDGNVCNAGTCQPNIASYNNATVFQANTIWSGPLKDGQKVDNTINATPNDGLEAAFNAYLSQYLEVYPDDLAHAVTTDPLAPWDAQRWYEGA